MFLSLAFFSSPIFFFSISRVRYSRPTRRSSVPLEDSALTWLCISPSPPTDCSSCPGRVSGDRSSRSPPRTPASCNKGTFTRTTMYYNNNRGNVEINTCELPPSPPSPLLSPAFYRCGTDVADNIRKPRDFSTHTDTLCRFLEFNVYDDYTSRFVRTFIREHRRS